MNDSTMAAGAAPTQDRLHVIDAIRAVALYGVIAMNLVGMVMGFISEQMLAKAGAADYVFAGFDLLFLMGKARSAFALLFGVGFGLLLGRSQAKGHAFLPFYLRRMTALLAFGLCNLAFLFFGDILILYALLGFVLILFRNWPDRALLGLGLALVVLPPIAAGLGELVLGGPLPNLAGLTPEQAEALVPATAPIYLKGSYLAVVGANLRYFADSHLANTASSAVYELGVLGLFLVGFWIARNGVLADVARWRPLLRRIAWTCLPAGLLLGAVHGTRRLGIEAEGAAHALVTAAYLGLPAMAFGYVAALALWFAGSGRRAQAALAPMGRMALTGYLTSNALGGFIWNGWGLGQMGRWNIAAINLLALAMFVLFCGASALWLRVFRFGPCEWLWRCLSYGRIQPMRRAPPASGPPAPLSPV